jgi:hypothetical protein
MYTAVASDGIRTQTTKSKNLDKLIEQCLEAEEVYGAETHIENSAGSIVWSSDPDEIEQGVLA